MKGLRFPKVSQANAARKPPPGVNGWRVKERKSEQSIELTSRRSVPVLRSKSVSPYAQTMAASGWASAGSPPSGRRRRAVGGAAHRTDKGQPNRRRLGRAACVIAVTSTAVAVLTMAGPLWQWFGFGGSSRTGIAEAHLSSAPIADQGKVAKEPLSEIVDPIQLAPREAIRDSDAEAALQAMKALVTARESTTNIDEQRQTLVSGEGYQLYLGAYRKEVGARYMWAGFRADLGPLLDNLTPQFERIQDENGTAYRVLAGTIPSLDDAGSLCARLREQEVACSIVRR